MQEIQTRRYIDVDVRPPGSKSITHRALITAGLARGESLLDGFLACDDTRYTLQTLRALGARISVKGTRARVIGTGGNFASAVSRKRIFIGNSGTSMRLLLSVVALSRGEFLLDGTSRMRQRPVGPLVEALNQLGSDLLCLEEKGHPPVLVQARGIRGGSVRISGKESSQYLSSLLLAGPYAENDVKIAVEGKLMSQPYVDMTLDVMRAFGVEVFRDGHQFFKVKAGHGYSPREFSIEADATSASYFWAAAAVTAGKVVTGGLAPFCSRQGDIRFLDILGKMGCHVEAEEDRATVCGSTLSGVEVDMSAMPDLVPTLAAVALFANGRSVIRNVPHLRHKESDRLQAVRLEWERLGAQIEELPDGLIIHGGVPLSGTVVDPHDDHRLAMSLAVVGLRVPGVKIRDEGCVRKSFPQFWELWARL